MTENGYVKLYRTVTQREWFGEGATLTVYVFLLCAAAIADMEYAGRTLRKGQYITSVKTLSEKCQLSVQQTRTALLHLKATNDITIETTSAYSIITVNTAVDAEGFNKPSNTLANTLVNKRSNNIIRSKEENIKKENNKGEAAGLTPPLPAFESGFSHKDKRQALVELYGSDAVTLYENKFRAWAADKNVNAAMYPTIEKWLKSDMGAHVRSAPKPAPTGTALNKDDMIADILQQFDNYYNR